MSMYWYFCGLSIYFYTTGTERNDNIAERAIYSSTSCPLYQRKCADRKQCIGSTFFCDGFEDCDDGSDEKNCNSCQGESQKCANVQQCVETEKFCDLRQNDCKDGSDERNCESYVCQNGRRKCADGKQCVDADWFCDGDKDCDDDSDERFCNGPLLVVKYITVNFNQASDFCRKKGWYLAMPKTSEIQDALANYTDTRHNTTYWIGLQRVDQYKWQWVDGTPLGDFKKWGTAGSAQPENFDCVDYRPLTSDVGEWNAAPCHYIKPFICQYTGEKPAIAATVLPTRKDNQDHEEHLASKKTTSTTTNQTTTTQTITTSTTISTTPATTISTTFILSILLPGIVPSLIYVIYRLVSRYCCPAKKETKPTESEASESEKSKSSTVRSIINDELEVGELDVENVRMYGTCIDIESSDKERSKQFNSKLGSQNKFIPKLELSNKSSKSSHSESTTKLTHNTSDLGCQNLTKQ